MAEIPEVNDPELVRSGVTRIVGQDEAHALDIARESGRNRAQVSSLERFDEVLFGSISVGTVAILLCVGIANMLGRRGIFVQNLGVRAIFVHSSVDFILTKGWKIDAGVGYFFAFSDAVNLYAITTTGTCDVRIIEGS